MLVRSVVAETTDRGIAIKAFVLLFPIGKDPDSDTEGFGTLLLGKVLMFLVILDCIQFELFVMLFSFGGILP